MDGLMRPSYLYRITLRQIEIFLAVCRSRHFSRAAEELALTQPAVSAQIRQLEKLVTAISGIDADVLGLVEIEHEAAFATFLTDTGDQPANVSLPHSAFQIQRCDDRCRYAGEQDGARVAQGV